MNKHFIDFKDLSLVDLQQIIKHAIELKKQHKKGIVNNILHNKTLAMIFDKSSTRTRLSFEVGMKQLGGNAVFLSSDDTQLKHGESIVDSSIVISSMVDIIILRLSSHDNITKFSKYSKVPVINALSDKSHPCQLLADLMTYQEHIGEIKGKTIAWVGDGNNVCNTYIQAAKIFNFNLNIASPKNYMPDTSFTNDSNCTINLYQEPVIACKNADLVVTDAWTSMGHKAERKQRILAFENFKVDKKLMSVAKKNAVFMHCLPAHRGEEVSSEVIDSKQSLVWHEAENRLHAQKALLLFLLNKATNQ